MKTPPHDYSPGHRTRTTGGLLQTRLRKDGRRASLMLDGILLEVGTPARIERRYRFLSQKAI